tara:strand:+ start:1656 stop:2138 length:483 start_codon:yes stop_codon:yes gene_type:complete
MVTIPSGVFTKYGEFADSMLASTGFGVPCKLVYTEKIEVIDNQVVPNPKQRKLMNIHNTSPDSGFRRGSKSFKTVETTEDITLRVYWDKKDFRRFGNIEVPDGSVMTIGNHSDMIKINRAKALLINTDKTGNVEFRFVKTSEPTIHGLDSDYFMCFWGRA